MSETDKIEGKPETELWYSDLTKLFESSEPEPAELYVGKIQNYDKKFFVEEPKIIAAENIIEKEKPESFEENLVENFERDVTLKDEEEGAWSLAFETFEENLISKIRGEELSSGKDQSSSHSSATKTFKDSKKDDGVSTSSSKESYFSDLRSSLSLSSSCERTIRKFLADEYSVFDVVDLDECYSVWDYNVPAKKLSFDQRIKKDLLQCRNLNIVVCVGTIRFRCHPFILRSAGYFRKSELESYTFAGEDNQLEAVAFSIFYDFALGSKPKISSKHLLSVKNAARILDVPELDLYCMKLLDSEVYQENEAFEIFKTAKAFNLPIMQALMMQRIFKFFLSLVASEDFIEMDVDDACKLLESDTIGVNSEIEVFFAGILWLNSKWNQRDEIVLIRVMSCVRYGLLPPWFTYMLQKPTGVVEVDRVTQCQDVSKMITDSAAIGATISLHLKDNSKYEDIVQRVLPQIPNQRLWIYDSNCAYHYGAHETVLQAVDYGVFKEYLKVVLKGGKSYWSNFHEGALNHFEQIFCQQFSDTRV